MSIPQHAATIASHSLWDSEVDVPHYPSLSDNVTTDVCIVGGGMAGLSVAYGLLRKGFQVCVLDDGTIGGGNTHLTSAHLASVPDRRFATIERLHGTGGAKIYHESHGAAISQIESIAAREEIACDFTRVDGYLFLGEGDEADTLDGELDVLRRIGNTEALRLDRAPLLTNIGPCVLVPNQAQFHPMKYLAGLAAAVQRAGGLIFTGTHATGFTGGKDAAVRAGEHEVRAQSIVIATNSPVNDWLAMHTKQAGYISYVVGIPVPTGSVTRALYWDTENPFHYVRLQHVRSMPLGQLQPDDRDILVVGGEDHKTGQADDLEARHARLQEWAAEKFNATEEPEFAWSGQVMETVDGVGFIGRNPMDEKNVYIVTGDCGQGLTHSAIAGMLISGLIADNEHPWEALYSPARKTVRAAGEFAREALNMAAQYGDWVTGGDVKSDDEIVNDSGAILRDGLSKIAVYRDITGKLHRFSAVCPHLEGIVRWNPVEKTWDCPCHSSRFDCYGVVIEGPANTNLKPLNGA